MQEKLRQVLSENPTLQVRFLVSESASMSFECTQHEISNIQIEDLTYYNGAYYTADNLREYLNDTLEIEHDTEEELEEQVEEMIGGMFFESFITVTIG